MPSYQIVYSAEEVTSTKNYIAHNVIAALGAVLDAENENWKGRLVQVDIKKVRD